jgi:hypothetical protein
LIGLDEQTVAEDQNIHFGSHETVVGIMGGMQTAPHAR